MTLNPAALNPSILKLKKEIHDNYVRNISKLNSYLKEMHFPSAPVLPSTGLSINAF